LKEETGEPKLLKLFEVHALNCMHRRKTKSEKRNHKQYAPIWILLGQIVAKRKKSQGKKRQGRGES